MCIALLCIARHKDLATVAGLHAHGLAKRGLARAKVTTRCSGFFAGTGKTVIETALALVAKAIALTRLAITLTEAAASIVLIVASTSITMAR